MACASGPRASHFLRALGEATPAEAAEEPPCSHRPPSSSAPHRKPLTAAKTCGCPARAKAPSGSRLRPRCTAAPGVRTEEYAEAPPPEAERESRDAGKGARREAGRGVWEEPQGLWRKEAAELRDRGRGPAPRPQAADGPQRGAAAATVDAGVLLGTDSQPRRGRGHCPESASSVRRGGAARAPVPERARRLGVCLGGSQPAPPPG